MQTSKFEFPSLIAVQLLNVNTRKELHGEEHVQAVDLSFKADFPNTILDDIFAPGLRDAMYFNAAADSGQVDLEGVDSTLPNLRFSKLNGQRFTWGGKDKLVGYTLRLEFGLGDDESNIELELCKVSGRVSVFWKVQNASERLDMETCGKLVLLGGEEVTMSLTAPIIHQEDERDEPENPFLNQDPAPLDRDPDDIGSGPLFPETPEDALASSLAAA